ncbi:TPA: DUF3310 domain-containing protein [Streptococcus suis]|nr:DUF3310 domain-containing protein [Streptococcus suis]
MGEPKSWALASVEGKEGQFNNVTKPRHYQGKYGLEVIEVIKNFLTEEELRGYYKGNALKYLLRERSKNGLEDLKKLGRYLDWLTEMEEANERR